MLSQLCSRFTLLIFRFEHNSLNNLICFLRGFFFIFSMLLLICLYFNVYYKCISSSLKNFWHSPKRTVFDCTHCANTVYALYSNSTILLTWPVHHWSSLYIHTDSYYTELKNMVRGYWNTLYKYDHCTGVLIYTVKY